MPDERIRPGRDEHVGMSVCCMTAAARSYARARTAVRAGVELAQGVVGGVSQIRACESERCTCDGQERQGWKGREGKGCG